MTITITVKGHLEIKRLNHVTPEMLYARRILYMTAYISHLYRGHEEDLPWIACP